MTSGSYPQVQAIQFIAPNTFPPSLGEGKGHRMVIAEKEGPPTLRWSCSTGAWVNASAKTS